MGLTAFLKELYDSGSVLLEGSDAPQPEELDRCADVLREADRLARLNLPHTPPPLEIESATWAAAVLYRGCQFLVFRDLPAEEVIRVLGGGCPHEATPAVVYSVDLSLRYLPDLLALARGLAPDDPLVKGLIDLGRRWPLSSVGIPDIGEVAIDSFIDDPCLGQLYVDRILARNDTTRTADPRAGDLIRRSLGLHEDLCPAMAEILQREPST